jgi:RimJ/RimL family protein N-acetyltransferase
VIRYGENERALQRIVGLVRPENEHSIALLVRCGFAFEKAMPLRNKTLHVYVRERAQATELARRPSD